MSGREQYSVMASYIARSHTPPLLATIYTALWSFPIAGFTLALISDIAYLQTSNLLWLHFAEWLLFAGIANGGIAFLIGIVDFLISRRRPSWPTVISTIVALILALINNFAHTVDGWTAVMPMGLTLSALTVLALLVVAIFAVTGARHD
jgi:uncharacterized membrane protein